eukprot:7968337-Karenia_brevis.AAC.1
MCYRSVPNSSKLDVFFPPNFACEWGFSLTLFCLCPPACQATPPDRYLPSAGHPAAIRRPSAESVPA